MRNVRNVSCLFHGIYNDGYKLEVTGHLHGSSSALIHSLLLVEVVLFGFAVAAYGGNIEISFVVRIILMLILLHVHRFCMCECR